MKRVILLSIVVFFISFIPFLSYSTKIPEEQRRGCCSHHGGVCGCENGRTKCCDGTYSPSCRCD